MSNLRATLDADYQLIDFERALRGNDGVNVVNSRYVSEPLRGWIVRHEISTERRTLEETTVPVTRVVMYFCVKANARPVIVLGYVYGLLDPEWELYARFVGADAVASESQARSLANRLLDGLLHETGAHIGP